MHSIVVASVVRTLVCGQSRMRYVELSQVLHVVERSFEFVRRLECSSQGAADECPCPPLQRVRALLADLYPLLVELTCIPQLTASTGAFAAVREDSASNGSATATFGQMLRRVLLHYAFLLQRLTHI